ncbi:hypothetical protein G6F58_013571 [Rhizopus delemar]|nr:hypothetical protein G6F58_013571 [Rhizopus delemar]
MRATDQIKALELMAIDPVAKAVAPRFWAAVLTVPLLTGIFCSLAISASYFEAVNVLGLDNGVFCRRSSAAPPRWSPPTLVSTPSRPSRAPRWRPPVRWSTPRCWC